MKPFKIAKVFNIMQKWQNFAKSGHTALNSYKSKKQPSSCRIIGKGPLE